MEADSTTYEENTKFAIDDKFLPFTVSINNYHLYNELTKSDDPKNTIKSIVQCMQNFGLLRKTISCPTNGKDCAVSWKTARVVDKVQWVCKSCDKRQPIRIGSFFHKLPCSLLQALQIILAWSEDIDWEVAANHFGVKPKVAQSIYYHIDKVAIEEQNSYKLGGADSVVLVEMFPNCVTRLSPDTTEQHHSHQILMLADTNHVPTQYVFHVLEESSSKKDTITENESVMEEIERVVSARCEPDALVVRGPHAPAPRRAHDAHSLAARCDPALWQFLSSSIWRQAVVLCTAGVAGCGGADGADYSAECARGLQAYLSLAAYRVRHSTHLYRQILTLLSVPCESNQ